jgi:hypothetical protein
VGVTATSEATGERAHERPTAAHARRWSGPTIVAAVLAVAQLCWHAWALAGGFFTQDDYLFIARADTEPLSAGYLLYEHNGHLMPGQFLLVWVVTRLAPLSWPVAIAPIVLIEAASAVLLWLLLVRLFGRRWEILVPFAVVLCSPLVFVASMWWAVALQVIPFQLVLFGALYFQIGYVRDGRRRDAVAALAWTLAGLLMWEKTLLVVPVLLGVTVLAAPAGPLAAVRRHWRLGLAYGGLVAGYLVLYAVVAWRTDRPALDPAQAVTLTRRLIAEALLPSLFGGPWTVNLFSPQTLVVPPAGVLAVAWALTALVVVAGLLVGRRRALGAWLLLAAYLLAASLALAIGRLHFIGPIIGWDYRLIADAVSVAAVCGALAFMAPRSERPPGPGRPPSGRARLMPVAVLALVAVFVAGATVSSARSVPQMRNEAARDYVERVDAALALEPNLMLYDTPVPDHVMAWLFGDEQRMASRVLGPLGARFDQPTGDLRMLDAAGTPRQIGLVDVVTGRPGPAQGCGYPVGPSGTRIRLTDFTDGPRRVVQLSYYTQRPSAGSVSTPTGQYPVRFDAALGHVYVVTDGPFDELLVSAEDNVCVTGVVVGAPLPRPS